MVGDQAKQGEALLALGLAERLQDCSSYRAKNTESSTA